MGEKISRFEDKFEMTRMQLYESPKGQSHGVIMKASMGLKQQKGRASQVTHFPLRKAANREEGYNGCSGLAIELWGCWSQLPLPLQLSLEL